MKDAISKQKKLEKKVIYWLHVEESNSFQATSYT